MAKYLLSVSEIKELEKRANVYGLTYASMMERAGRGVAQKISKSNKKSQAKHILGLVGTGNNGGDGLIAMEQLLKQGWSASALLPRPRPEASLSKRFLDAGGELIELYKAADPAAVIQSQLKQADLILDCLIGTGFHLPLAQDLQNFLELIAAFPKLPQIIALDCPSGVDCDSGAASSQTLKASWTICMEAVKKGLLKFPAAIYSGKLSVVPLDLPEKVYLPQTRQTQIIDNQMGRALIPTRPVDAHKGNFGSLLIIAGSRRFTGAALLAGKAALRTGAGLVYMAIPEAIHAPAAASIPEAIWEVLPCFDGVLAPAAAGSTAEIIPNKQAVLIGPGLSLREGVRACFTSLFLEKLPSLPVLPPFVVDADGLRLLAGLKNWPDLLTPGSVLTPHPGEMSALTDLSVADIQAERIETARHFAQIWHQVLVLKGAFTVVAAPDGQARVLPLASSALSHGGTGDVLAGMIASLIAQGLSAFDAASLGVWLHGQCARRALRKIGHPASVLPSDLIDQVGSVLKRGQS